MTLENIKTILSELNISVAYNHFNKRTEPPYVVYYVQASENLFADNKVISENVTVLIELYTKNKDIKLERQLKNILNNNELPYELVGESFIEEDNVYQIVYQVNLIDLTD